VLQLALLPCPPLLLLLLLLLLLALQECRV
jgi:hypothetical protein